MLHPVRGATVGLLPDKLLAGFQSTHPMRGATGADSVYKVIYFNQRTPCGVQLKRLSVIPILNFNLAHPVRGATIFVLFGRLAGVYLFQSSAPRAGCNSKTIQSKRTLAARRMYNFANYVLHILKHQHTYCIGTTLQPLFFSAKLPAILCSLEVRTASITLL